MSKKVNGSGNGKDGDDNVAPFPTLAERDRIRKEKLKQEQAEEKKSRKTYYKVVHPSNDQPFFNASRIPPFTRIIVPVFVLIHILLFLVLDSGTRLQAFYMLGFVPAYFTGQAGGVPWFAFLGPFTHMFIHGGWMHLAFNSVMMLALGTMFERTCGTRLTIFFFFACGLLGALTYFALNPFVTIPVIGASGGISGLFGAALIILNTQGQFAGVGKRRMWPMIAFWAALMIVMGFIGGASLAWQAHLGGFLGGVGLFILIQKGKIRF